jgi:hypothetical protein
MTKIIHATITGRRLFITFTDGTLEVGLPQKDIPSFLDLIPLMIGSRITERLLDRDKNFFSLSFANDEKKIYKFFSFTFDEASDEFNWSALSADGSF